MANHGPSTPYRPFDSAGLGSSVFGWLRSLFGAQPVYRVPPPEQPAEVPSQPAPEDSPTQGESPCSQGPVTIVIGSRD